MQRVVTEPAETLALFRAGCDWAERISLCLSRSDSAKGGLEAWRILEPNLTKVDVAIVNVDGGSAEPQLVRDLNESGVLRIAPGTPAVMSANVYLFRRGAETRVLLGSADFTDTGFKRGISATVYATGQSGDEFFCGVQRLFERCAALAHVPTLQDVDTYSRAWRRGGSMLPAPPTAIAALPIHEPLVMVTDRAGVAACMAALEAATETDRAEGRLQINEADERWSLCFSEDDHGRTIELSISKAVPDGRCDGAFAVGEKSGRKYLVYRALFRSRARVAEQLFWSSTRYRPVEIPSPESSAGEPGVRVAVVCELGTVEAPAHLAGLGTELRRVREHGEEPSHDEDEDSSDFLDEDTEVQTELVWNTLYGEGPLEKDTAVRIAARVLREAGSVSYKRLDGGGLVYSSIETAIEAGIREGSFDRPRRGYVRAIVAEIGPDEWRHCLLSTLAEDATDRDEAIRAAAEYAAEYFGIRFERLRRGGRIEKALKSAINSCLRRGLVGVSDFLCNLTDHQQPVSG